MALNVGAPRQHKRCTNRPTSSTVRARSWSPFEWPIELVGSWEKWSPSSENTNMLKRCILITNKHTSINFNCPPNTCYFIYHLISTKNPIVLLFFSWRKHTQKIKGYAAKEENAINTTSRKIRNSKQCPIQYKRMILTINWFRIELSTFTEYIEQSIHYHTSNMDISYPLPISRRKYNCKM